MAEQRKYRKFTAKQKAEVVLGGIRGDRSAEDFCREHQIAETLYCQWRDKLLVPCRARGLDHACGFAQGTMTIHELARATQPWQPGTESPSRRP